MGDAFSGSKTMNRFGNLRRAGAGCLVLASGLIALPAVADISFTPRAGVYFDNGSQRQSRAAPVAANTQQLLTASDAVLKFYGGTVASKTITTGKSSQAAIPQFGGTLTFTWGDSGKTDVALTALYGQSHVRGDTFVQNTLLSYSVLDVTAIDNLVQGETYDNTYKRFDLEATLQHRLNETFSLVGGVRAERTTGERPITVVETSSANFLNALRNKQNQLAAEAGQPLIPGAYVGTYSLYTFNEHLTNWTYSLRGGAAAYSAFDEKHLFFVTGMLQVTRNPGINFTDTYPTQSVKYKDAAETTVGPDISVGYIYQLSDRFNFDVRYRASIYFPVSGPFDFKDSRVNHGLMLGFTTWFGGR
jgi:hypothetical protein